MLCQNKGVWGELIQLFSLFLQTLMFFSAHDEALCYALCGMKMLLNWNSCPWEQSHSLGILPSRK